MLNPRLRNASPVGIRLVGVLWLVLGGGLLFAKLYAPQGLQGNWNSSSTYIIAVAIIAMGLYHLLTGKP